MRLGRSAIAILLAPAILAGCTSVKAPQPAIAAWGVGPHPVGDLVRLDGSKSSDPQGRPLSYRWVLTAEPAGSRARVAGADRAIAALTPDEEGAYGVELVVSNGLLARVAQATLTARCGVAAPAITMGPAPEVPHVGSPVALSATVTDPDAQAPCSLPAQLSYHWDLVAVPAGSAATLSGTSGLSPWFVPDLAGKYVAELTASDGRGHASRATLEVDVGACGSDPPVITPPASPLTGRIGAPVQLSVAATDPDAQAGCTVAGPLGYRWAFLALPVGSHARLNDPALATPSFTPDVAGTYLFRVTVTASNGRSAMAQIEVDVASCGGNAPAATIQAGTTNPAVGEAVALSATVTDDDQATCGLSPTFAYAWHLDQLPAGSAARLSDPAAQSPWLVPDQPGTYVVSLTVTASNGRRSALASVTLTAGPCGSNAPVVTIAPPPAGSVGVPVQLGATETDADASASCGLSDSVTWSWAFTSLPSGSVAHLQSADGPSPWFVPDRAGEYDLEALATDAAGHVSAPQIARVTVGECGSHAPVIRGLSATQTAAGVRQPVELTANVTDPDSACNPSLTLSYAWSFISLPPASHAKLLDPTGVTSSFLPDVAGTFGVQLVVTDSNGRASAPATTLFDVPACGTASPVPVPSTVTPALNVGQPIALSVSTTDANSACATETLAYAWSFDALPPGSHAALTGAAGPSPSFVADLPGTYAVRVTATDSSGQTGFATLPVEVTQCGAQAPTVSATTLTAAAVTGSPVALSATATDPDNDASCGLHQTISYAWSFDVLPPGSQATFNDATSLDPSFTPDVAGTYVAQVVVTDSTGRSAFATVSVDVAACALGAPGVAISASVEPVSVGSVVAFAPTVTFPGATAGCSATGEQLSYSWQLAGRPAGSTAALSSTISPTPLLIPDLAGGYTVRLTVTDAAGQKSAPASLTISAASCTPALSVSARPTAPAFGATVSLVGSYTPCAGVPTSGITYAWHLTQAPSTSAAALGGANRATASLAPDAPGTYSAELAVSDGVGHYSTATASVTTSACGFAIPSAAPSYSGPTNQVGVPIQLAANPSDANGGSCGATLSYAWRLSAEPPGSQAVLSSSAAETPSFLPDLGGTYVATVVVTDSFGRSSAPAQVSVTVSPACTNPAPVALAQMIEPTLQATAVPAATTDVTSPALLACRFQLDARGSSFPAQCSPGVTSNQLSFSWQQTDAPMGSQSLLSDATSATPWFDVDQPGLYSFEVYANYNGATSKTPATVTVYHQGFWIAKVAPAVSCQSSVPSSLTLTAGGQGFLIDASGNKPTVTFDGNAPQNVTLSGCGSSAVAGIQTCSTMTLSLPGPPNSPGVGNHLIVVQNPVQDGCVATASYYVGPPPTLTSASPNDICSSDDPLKSKRFLLSVTGSGFGATTDFTLASQAPIAPPWSDPEAPVDVSNGGTAADVSFARPEAQGAYSLTANNGTGCTSAPLQAAVNVLAVPIVFFADPPVLYSGISTDVTIYLSGLNGNGVDAVGLRPVYPDGSTGPLQWLSSFTFDPTLPDQLEATVPPGLSAATYQVLVTDRSTCTSIPAPLITVTSNLTLALGSVAPPFGQTGTNTSVDLFATNPPPAGQEAFSTAGLPRVYLNPASGGGAATALQGVTVLNAGELTAVVPQTVPAGTYDVIVVNPDGAVGVLKGAYTEVTVPPPVIDSLTPGSIPNSGTQAVTVRGSGFATGTQPTVTLNCENPTGPNTSYTVPVEAGNTATDLIADVPAASLTAGDICVARVTNPDGTYGEFSALGVTNSSLNLNAFAAVSSMGYPRRAPAVTSARATRSARYLYAIGGDDGSPATARSDMEAAPLDQFGNLGAWRLLPTVSWCDSGTCQPMNVGVTLASATTLGRYVYLAGGDIGGIPFNEAGRALVLDPTQAPTITNLMLALTPDAAKTACALGPGYWYYRVSAVMQSSDADDPSGEGLPSDPLVISLPDLSSQGECLQPTITWPEVTDANSYIIYRSPSANASANAIQQLATMSASGATCGSGSCTYTDNGGGTQSGTAPHQLGDLGNFVQLPSLNDSRAGMGFTVALDPSSPGTAYVYAVAGLNPSLFGGTPDPSYEYLPVTIDPTTGEQTYGAAWTKDNSNTLLTPRWQAGLFRVTDVEATDIPPADTWLYLGPGVGSSGTSGAIDAAMVQSGGALSTWTSEKKQPNPVVGYGFAAAADQLLTFGGAGSNGGTPSDNIDASSLLGCGGVCTGGPSTLGNWNNNGAKIVDSRYLPGTAVESAHIFLVGGEDLSGATNTVESVVW